MSNWMFALGAMLVYLALAFALGLLAGRKRSFWSVSEYAVADRGLGFIVVWFMMGGTVFSAFAFLGGPGMAFSEGAAAYFVPAYLALGILPWYVLGPKVGRIGARKNFVTLGEFVGDRYRSRALTVLIGVISVLAFIQYLTLQIKGMAFIFSILTEGAIPYWFGALLAYGIVVVYVASSGVRGAAWSDVLQGALMLIVAWAVGFYLVYTLHGGPSDMFSAIASERPDFLTIGRDGSPMSSMAFFTHSAAKANSDRPEFLVNSVWPMPTMTAHTSATSRPGMSRVRSSSNRRRPAHCASLGRGFAACSSTPESASQLVSTAPSVSRRRARRTASS